MHQATKESFTMKGRASLSPASRIKGVPNPSSGSPGRTRPTGFMGVGASLRLSTSHDLNGGPKR
ncbi:MAG: hypothetical protein FJ398_25845 [Verrucomicrobia bacterium]|nr:hypothetical protein [Verrucomicrobiota bacterium]